MLFPEVDRLFKYMPWNENTQDCLISNRFWFSSPEKFNDPFDCAISLSTDNLAPNLRLLDSWKNKPIVGLDLHDSKKSLEAVRQHVAELLRDIKVAAPHLSEEVKAAQLDEMSSAQLKSELRNLGVTCLTEQSDNMLMWSHYAGQHTGICIEFERSQNNMLADDGATLPVRYSSKLPKLFANAYRSGSGKDRMEIERSLIYTKSLDWAYEREWRISMRNTAQSLQEIKARVRSITFGVRACQDCQIFAGKFAIERKLILNRAMLRSNEFGLKIEELLPIRSQG